jgi:hypothetical protein
LSIRSAFDREYFRIKKNNGSGSKRFFTKFGGSAFYPPKPREIGSEGKLCPHLIRCFRSAHLKDRHPYPLDLNTLTSVNDSNE